MPEVNLTLTARYSHPDFLVGQIVSNYLTLEERRHIKRILTNYAHVFHDKTENDFKCHNVVEHQIQVGDKKPITKPPYRTP